MEFYVTKSDLFIVSLGLEDYLLLLFLSQNIDLAVPKNLFMIVLSFLLTLKVNNQNTIWCLEHNICSQIT